MKRSLCSTLAALALVIATAGARAADKPAGAEADARRAAESWLALVDAGKTAESWQQSSTLFRGVVTQEAWSSAVQAVRGPLGALTSRHFRSAQYTASAPGAPDGHYVVLQYDAVFANKAAAVETVTPKLDADGVWRVSGYFIR
jgi:hypothetical protein